ncbi:mitochondrial ribosomal death-associated protein 3-domain-containing protein [Russula earlei]|uniref:Mitochondrial ribosomal death-associated protein 3-domain-containing protein n=1 Tax=Russula earlei TaxID=71964 RepID=A0ACC0U5Y9_9AGAM|nr:mitochondrial ribosomal death-associated protein 3-domain-containing protein [Russula earlei]
MSTLSASTRPRALLSAFRREVLSLNARLYAAQAKGGPVKQHAQGYKGGKGQKLTNKQRRMEAIRNNKSPGAFVSLPASQLRHELFQSQRLDELDLPYFRAEDLTEGNLGKALAFPLPENDAVRVFGMPRNVLLDFRILSKAVSVVRDVTIKLVDRLQAASEESSERNRFVLSGSAGCGKSYLLIQGVEYAASAGWIVMYIPRAINLVNSSTPYSYDLRAQTYLQPVFAQRTLERFRSVNEHAISSLVTEDKVDLDDGLSLPQGTPLLKLIDVGLKDQTSAPTVLAALLEALGKQTKVPVLLAIDDFQALFTKTAYKTPQFQTVRAWHLSMPRLLLEYASGRKVFARGAVVGALSLSDKTYSLSQELRHALGLQPWLRPSPYLRVAPEITTFTRGVQVVKVPEELNVNEAATLFEVWNKNRSLHTPGNDELFLAKYTESGGNPRDFVWKGLLSTLQT